MGSALPEPPLLAEPALGMASSESLHRTLRALWRLDVPVLFGGEVPHLAQGAIHLPLHAPAGADDGAWRLAASAHAAAHLVYSPPAFDGRGLKPIVRALVGVLEDARVEALACRELPGLCRWWVPRHTATPLDGDGVEVLLLRLSRALADPGYDDPHPWVRKGRALFFLDAAGQVMAEPRADHLRMIASRLGHDLGQMRLQFNARSHRPGPDYRDDHRWMWPEAAAEERAEQPAPPPPAGHSAPEPAPDDAATPHPEWDRLIARLRPAWCRVVEQPADAHARPHVLEDVATPASLRRALLGRRAGGRWHHGHTGTQIDLDALVRARIARRLGEPVDPRVLRSRSRDRRAGHALLLVDQSASAASAWPHGPLSQLHVAAAWAWLAARALAGTGLAVAMAGFSSAGRHAVQWRQVLGFGQPLDLAARARLAGLVCGGSTRLGAALRHALRQLARHRDGERLVLVISDADVHDIDVHDPRYLVDDARHAVRHARRQGVRVTCLLTDGRHAGVARRIFGGGAVARPKGADELPNALRRLIG
ncbi:MAG: nitric oxide reductase activation protein NorD [Piscinibacter sp.]|uniref:nitric oxide reductase activation protein NorD n=1 Tax=Piscinibacter sp. TaxID=1903157 RepID=UPI003D0D4B6A